VEGKEKGGTCIQKKKSAHVNGYWKLFMQIQNISITIHQCTALSFLFVQYMRRYSRYGHAEDVTCRATVEPV